MEQLANKNVKEAIYNYALAVTKRNEQEFPNISIHTSNEGTTTFNIPYIHSAANWGGGDLHGIIKEGQVTIYEKDLSEDISGVTWSTVNRFIKKESLEDIIKQYNPQQEQGQEKDLKKELADSYNKYLATKENEVETNVDTILQRAIAEQEYYSLKQNVISSNEISEEQINSMEKQLNHKSIEQNKPSSEQYKENYKDQVLEDISSTKEEDHYKENYKKEILAMLGISNEKTLRKEENRGQTKDTDQEKGSTLSDREKRIQEMKEFEKNNSFDEVYKLKKEVLQELKGMNLNELQRDKLTKLEKALDNEKKEHDKAKEEKQEQKKGFASFFSRNKNDHNKQNNRGKPKEQEIER